MLRIHDSLTKESAEVTIKYFYWATNLNYDFFITNLAECLNIKYYDTKKVRLELRTLELPTIALRSGIALWLVEPMPLVYDPFGSF